MGAYYYIANRWPSEGDIMHYTDSTSTSNVGPKNKMPFGLIDFSDIFKPEESVADYISNVLLGELGAVDLHFDGVTYYDCKMVDTGLKGESTTSVTWTVNG